MCSCSTGKVLSKIILFIIWIWSFRIDLLIYLSATVTVTFYKQVPWLIHSWLQLMYYFVIFFIEHFKCLLWSCIQTNPRSKVLIWSPLFTCLPLRSLNRLHCQQAVLDKCGQWHYQQVQSGWQWAGSAGDTKKAASQRHSSGCDGWVELVASASDCHWGLVRKCGGITCLTS